MTLVASARSSRWIRRIGGISETSITTTRPARITATDDGRMLALDAGTGKLLIFSQVVLSLQLPFAVVPLVLFTASRRKLGPLTAPRWLTGLASLIAAIIIVLNVKLIMDFILS